MNHAPGRYLRLDLFIKVLSLLCPNLTDASTTVFLFLIWQRARARVGEKMMINA